MDNNAFTEIERRWLVNFKNIDFSNCSISSHIRQGYVLHGDNGILRVRQVESSKRIFKKNKYFLSFKSGFGPIRTEIEHEIDEITFLKYWDIAILNQRIIHKDRIVIKSIPNTNIEVDIFRGNLIGLCVAEAEFKDEDDMNHFIAPSWFDVEVTSDDRFSNFNLSTIQDLHDLELNLTPF